MLFLTTALSGVAQKSRADIVVRATPSYTLYQDRIVEGEDSAYVEERGGWQALRNARHEMVRPFLRGDYPRLRSDSALLEVLYRIALHDIEVNFIDGQHFRVSPDFAPDMIFTRDTAYTSLLGANLAMPEQMKQHLRKDRAMRRAVGFKTGTGQQIPIPAVAQLETVEKLNNKQFFEKYQTHPYARRTDDVCWVPGYWAAMQVSAAPDDHRWLLDEFDHFDRNFYAHFLDPADSLYFGQATFIDIGGTGYPENYSAQDSIMIKALSTNCLYVRAFDIVAEVSERLGEKARAAGYRQRAAALRAAILQNFRHPDGYYSYFKRKDGTLEPRVEILGSAFLVLFDILGERERAAQLARLPHNDFGNALFHPLFPGDRIYHNNAIWPFANTFFNQAEFAVQRSPDILLRTYGNLARHALQGNFNELMDYATGGRQELHARQYIWSAASFLGLVYNFLFGIEVVEGEKVRFHPLVPPQLGSNLALSGLVVRGTEITVTLKGAGSRITAVRLNGQAVAEATVPLDGRRHDLQIDLGP